MKAMTQHQSSDGARGQAHRETWRWRGTEDLQRTVLAAARELFITRGFSSVTVADITDRANVSVGSLYHHFGAKDQLYLSLWQEYGRARSRASVRAVAAARRAGAADPAELLAAGARAVLEQTWARRDLARLFFAGDGPPGFEARKRDRTGRLSRQVDLVLGIPDTMGNQLYAASLLCVIGEGARAVSAAPNLRQAQILTDAAVAQSRCLLTGGPAGCAAEVTD
jgi:AcrR family transcriptional regulator